MTRSEAFARAQKRANRTRLRHEVWCHDGDWGHRDGDIVGTREYRVVVAPAGAAPPFLPRGWVFHGLADPEVVGEAA